MYSILMYTLFIFLISLFFFMSSVVPNTLNVGISLNWLIYSFNWFNLNNILCFSSLSVCSIYWGSIIEFFNGNIIQYSLYNGWW